MGGRLGGFVCWKMVVAWRDPGVILHCCLLAYDFLRSVGSLGVSGRRRLVLSGRAVSAVITE